MRTGVAGMLIRATLPGASLSGHRTKTAATGSSPAMFTTAWNIPAGLRCAYL